MLHVKCACSNTTLESIVKFNKSFSNFSKPKAVKTDVCVTSISNCKP